MSKENVNNTEKVISNVTIEEILAGLKNANEKVIYNTTMEEILTNLKDFFTPKINRFNAGTFTYTAGEQEVYCGFEPLKIIVYLVGAVGYGTSEYNGCPLWIWENGKLFELSNLDSSGRTSIEINPDGFTVSGIGVGFEMQLRWEAYA